MLSLYLAAERLMLLSELVDDELADKFRDAMDPIWDALSDDERRALDEREVQFPRALEGLHVPLSDRLFCDFALPTTRRPFPDGPITGWRRAA